ncbi:MAG: ankyrin repeat domain-containing protein [Candidatus Kapabacteria bacterium]|nr:ankyrin repeat domain-containing protein [Candidatus Kapabacteria bacterium]MBP7093231.1 ankyrin repeat domain-containing protein [Candidatus Kapabacteria bacterium]
MTLLLIILALLFSVTASGCDRDRVVNKQRLHGNDVRLFQGTPAWDLAKAIEDEDNALIRSIVATDPTILRVTEPVYGSAPLRLATSMFKLRSLVALLKLDTNINARDSFYGETILIGACGDPDVPLQIVQTLVNAGCNVNDHAIGGRHPEYELRYTPLTVAADRGRADIVNLLLDHGARVNDTTNNGTSALTHAINSYHYGLAKSLIERGADYIRPLQRDWVSERPEYILETMRGSFHIQIGSKKHIEKMKLVAYLQKKGLDYDKEPIPEYIVEKAKKMYPATWREFLKQY